MVTNYEVGSNPSLEPDVPNNRPEAAYLEGVYDLTPELIARTIHTYSDPEKAERYAEIEWGSDMIRAVYKHVFPQLRAHLDDLSDPNALAILAGCGSLRDALMITMLNPKIHVVGFDISENLLNEGIERLNLVMFTQIGKELEALGENLAEWVIGLMTILQRLGEHLAVPEERLPGTRRDVDDSIARRLSTFKADLREIRDTNLKPNSANLVIADASLPHIPKSEMTRVLYDLINLLKPNGMLYFDFRLDPLWRESDKGRVFMDRALRTDKMVDQNGERNFATYTQKEIELLLRSLGTVEADFEPFTIGKIPQTVYIITTPGDRLKVELFDKNYHPHGYKPEFLNVTITKEVILA